MIKLFAKIDWVIEKFSLYTLMLSLITMLVLSLLTIGFRWVNTTYLWMDPAVRHLVFAAAFLGGILATGNRSHIGIDIISKFLEVRKLHRINRWQKRLVDLFSMVILIWLTKASVSFVQMELENGKEIILSLHSGVVVMIIPIGFALIAYRFFFHFLASFQGEK